MSHLLTRGIVQQYQNIFDRDYAKFKSRSFSLGDTIPEYEEQIEQNNYLIDAKNIIDWGKVIYHRLYATGTGGRDFAVRDWKGNFDATEAGATTPTFYAGGGFSQVSGYALTDSFQRYQDADHTRRGTYLVWYDALINHTDSNNKYPLLIQKNDPSSSSYRMRFVIHELYNGNKFSYQNLLYGQWGPYQMYVSPGTTNEGFHALKQYDSVIYGTNPGRTNFVSKAMPATYVAVGKDGNSTGGECANMHGKRIKASIFTNETLSITQIKNLEIRMQTLLNTY